MCSLFGFVDYGHQLSRKSRHRLLTVLSIASEERGTDATGIAYNCGGKQYIYKRPIPAHLMWYRVPTEAPIVMGHTRMATQGSAKYWGNNHPFTGNAGGITFSLAHNGCIYNDRFLRRNLKLPTTRIETDSYIAVQLIEKYGNLDFDALRFMAEELEGSFTITALTARNELYFVKGNNPMCIYHYPDKGIYVYASTEEILRKAMLKAKLPLGKSEKIQILSGEIIKIDDKGQTSRSHFDDSKLYPAYSLPWIHWDDYATARPYAGDSEYIRDLKTVAIRYGLFPEDIDALIRDGVDPMEIEELLYCY